MDSTLLVSPMEPSAVHPHKCLIYSQILKAKTCLPTANMGIVRTSATQKHNTEQLIKVVLCALAKHYMHNYFSNASSSMIVDFFG
jgi:hypothetical protein